ncbi:hypothetical protein FKP32DRAFT_1604222 [Trametes sanguinea]|nr:hypothetical protein FKP32DRAFT_1604222 [Trametes sanguinea]
MSQIGKLLTPHHAAPRCTALHRAASPSSPTHLATLAAQGGTSSPPRSHCVALRGLHCTLERKWVPLDAPRTPFRVALRRHGLQRTPKRFLYLQEQSEAQGLVFHKRNGIEHALALMHRRDTSRYRHPTAPEGFGGPQQSSSRAGQDLAAEHPEPSGVISKTPAGGLTRCTPRDWNQVASCSVPSRPRRLPSLDGALVRGFAACAGHSESSSIASVYPEWLARERFARSVARPKPSSVDQRTFGAAATAVAEWRAAARLAL